METKVCQGHSLDRESQQNPCFKQENSKSDKFYKLHHKNQTFKVICQKKEKFRKLNFKKATVWEMFKELDKIKDESDPDTESSQLIHALQTAEAIRKDGHPDWFVLVGLIHDLGKVLLLMGEPQWAVVGDTFPVGCRYSPKIVHYKYLQLNEDYSRAEYQKKIGIYKRNCGFDSMIFTWGHDEYLYLVLLNYINKNIANKHILPEVALYIIRYHSFYPYHQGKSYEYFMNEKDKKYRPMLEQFQKYDLYTKRDDSPELNVDYYKNLVNKYLSGKLSW